MTDREAMLAINTLRSEVIATQNAGWSNTIYPLVAILNEAGYEQFHPTEDQIREYLDCHGGAGGYPGHVLRKPNPGYCKPVGKLEHLIKVTRIFLDDPSDKNRSILENNLDS